MWQPLNVEKQTVSVRIFDPDIDSLLFVIQCTLTQYSV